jgi:calcineurin-like phosphoesterase family protein
MVYFTSDLHLQHKAIHKYRHFKTTEENDEYFLQKIESLKKRDILYILGDFIFDGPKYDEYIQRIRKAKCRIKLIMGNHDSLLLYKEINQKSQTPEGSIEIQLPFFSYKNFWISHCPIHPQEMRRRQGNIHGHLHNNVIQDDRYFNVSPERNNYEFVDFEKIKEYFKEKELYV